jgi:hypothetical protein
VVNEIPNNENPINIKDISFSQKAKAAAIEEKQMTKSEK